jgi:hypothetical protein
MLAALVGIEDAVLFTSGSYAGSTVGLTTLIEFVSVGRDDDVLTTSTG